MERNAWTDDKHKSEDFDSLSNRHYLTVELTFFEYESNFRKLGLINQ